MPGSFMSLLAEPDKNLSYNCKRGLTQPAGMQRQRRRVEPAASLQIHPPLSGEAMGKRRIVVTGMGVVTSLGHDVKELYDQLLQV